MGVPGYKVHLFGGLLPSVILVLLIMPHVSHSSEMFFVFLSCLLGALAPDIDTNSKGRMLFLFLILGAMVFAGFLAHWYVVLMLLFIAFVVLQARHRGMFHHFSLWMILVIFGIFSLGFYIPEQLLLFTLLGCSFLLGILSHIVLDHVRIR